VFDEADDRAGESHHHDYRADYDADSVDHADSRAKSVPNAIQVSGLGSNP
jgi:hypothetical protein